MPDVRAASVEIHPLSVCCWCGSPFVRGVVEILGLQPWTCPTEACWRRQVQHAMIVQLKGKERRCRFVPLPRQVEAMEALAGDPVYIMIGGAAGGSKSKGLREIAHAECLKHPNFRVLLLRRTFSELQSNHIEDSTLEAPEMDAECVPSAKVVRYKNGAILQFGHCETSADAAKYLSSEYDLIIFDELVTFEEVQFLLISSRARSTKAGVRPKILCGTNPGGPQSHWVRMRFIDKTVDREQFPDYDPNEWLFIPSKLEDNPYLDQQYERKLLALPPEMRKAYRDGDWDIFPGQYFPEWRKKTHVTHNAHGEPVHVRFPVELPRVIAMDWGYVKAGWIGWFVLLSDGGAYLEHEYVPVRVVAGEQGKEIARQTQALGLKKISYLVYDHQMESPQGDSGETIIETVRRGMKAEHFAPATRQADKDRKNGWARMRGWLMNAPDDPPRPWLRVSPTCPYAIRTIPAQISDKTDPEDMDTTGEDHACDTIRYFCMSRPHPAAIGPTQTPAKEWSLGWLKNRVTTPAGNLSGREVRVA